MTYLLRPPLIFLTFILLLVGCTRKSDFVGIFQMPSKGWAHTEKLEFEFTPDPAKAVNFLYQIRLSPQYLYQNIWLKYWLIGPNSETITSSKDNLFLFEPSGKPVGIGTHKLLYVDAYFLRNVRLTEAGRYRIVIQHYMRDDSLKGIHSLGIRQELAAD